MPVDWSDFEAATNAPATDWDQFAPLARPDPLPDSGEGDAQVLDPAHGLKAAASAVMDPVMKLFEKGASSLGNLPVQAYNIGSEITHAYKPVDLPFQPGKPVPGGAALGSAASFLVKNALEPRRSRGETTDMGEGLGNAASNTVTGMSTPGSLATMALLPLRSARAALALGMGAQAPAQIEDTASTIADPNVPNAQKWEALGNTGVNLAMTAALALGLTPDKVRQQFSPDEARDAAKGAPATPESEILNTAKTAPLPEAKNEFVKQPTQAPNENEAKTSVDESPQGSGGETDQKPSDQTQPGDQPQPAPGLDAGNVQEGGADVAPAAPGSEIPVSQAEQTSTETPNEKNENAGQAGGRGADEQVGQGQGATPGENASGPSAEAGSAVPLEKRLADPATFKGKNWTGDALKYGASLTDRAQLEELKALEAKYAKQIQTTPKDMANLNELMAASNRKQWVTEAIQGAEGVEGRDIARAQLPADYKAPFPKGEEPPVASEKPAAKPKAVKESIPDGAPIATDKGSYQAVPQSADFLPPEPAPKPAKAGGELFGAEQTPFNLAGEKQAAPAAPSAKPDEATTGYGNDTMAQQEMFSIQKIVAGKDPEKSADAQQQVAGNDPGKAAAQLRKQLAVVDSDPVTKKNFTKEQRARLKEVISLLEQRQVSRAVTGMGFARPAEFGTPTIEDQISGELAPPRDQRQPEPNNNPTTQTAIRGITQMAKDGWQSVKGWLGAVGNRTFPRLTLLNRHLGELGARWISAHIAAKPVAEVFAADVLGNSGIDPVRYGAALTEDNLRSIKDAYEKKADEARNRDEIVEELRGELENFADRDLEDPKVRKEKAQVLREISRISKLTDKDADRFEGKASRVKSFIGDQSFPFKSEDDYQKFLDDPKTKEVIARHKDLWNSVVDPQYKEAMSIDPDFELPSRGQQTGARINLKAYDPTAEEPARDVAGAGTRRGNLLGTLRKKSPFGVEAKGTGEAYHVNYYDLMENTFSKQMEIAAKNRFDQALVKEGQAMIAKPGQRVNIDGQPAVSFPLKRQKVVIPDVGGISQNEHIYVNRKIAGEYRRAANVDEKPANLIFKGFSGAFNQAALASGVDATTHAVNQLSTLATLPGGTGKLLRDSLLSAFPGRPDIFVTVAKSLAKAMKDNRAQLASIAEIGALKGEHEATKIPVMRQLSQGVAWLDKATRLTLDDTYKNLAAQGLVDGSETERREFINQVGQYNKRAQGYFKRWVRDTGLSPFVTAGTTFNNLGVRSLLLNPGVKASSNMARAALTGNMLAKLVGTATTVGLVNYLLTHKKGGGVLGRPGIPIGDIDLGTNDKNGRPERLALFSMIGPGRGARVTGLRGFLEAKKNGLPTGTALGAAARDALNAAFSPWAGPMVRGVSTAATGHPAAIDVPRASRVVPPGQNQAWENLKTAVRDANPVVAGIAKAMEPGSAGATEAIKSQLPRFLPQAGKPPEMMKDYPAIVRRAQANAFIEDVIGNARKMEPVARMSYLREQVKRLDNPADRQKAIKEFKMRKVLPR